MKGTGRIVAGTDFSERAERAEVRAAMLAQFLGENLELFHVVNPQPLKTLEYLTALSDEEADTSLMKTRGRLLEMAAAALESRFGLTVRRHVAVGRTAKTFASHAAHGADLVVVGAHGGNFVEDIFLGSTADKLAHKLHCPLLVVKNESCAAYRRVVVAVDFSQASRLAMEWAFRVAAGAEVLALHVFESPYEGKIRFAMAEEEALQHYLGAAATESRHCLRDFLEEWTAVSPPVVGQVEHGHVATVLHRKLRDWNADLLVMGKHGQSELERLLLGSNTEHMIYEAGCDVLIAAG
jgi:nucleotide-binding universal stress UspA family protein